MKSQKTNSPELRTQGIDHVSLDVADPVRSGRWYQEVLGLERRFEEAWGDVPFVVGAGTTSLALFESKRAAGEPEPAGLAPKSGHIAFRLDRETFDRAPAHLDAHGIAYREADYRISRSLHIEDPDGHHIELTTYEVD